MSSTMSGYSPNKSIRLQDARVPKRGTLQTSNSSNPKLFKLFKPFKLFKHGTRNAERKTLYSSSRSGLSLFVRSTDC